MDAPAYMWRWRRRGESGHSVLTSPNQGFAGWVNSKVACTSNLEAGVDT
jgi:hypothetical protein